MPSQATVHVSGISPATSEKEVRDFFSFWYVIAIPRGAQLSTPQNKLTISSLLQWQDYRADHHPLVRRAGRAEIRQRHLRERCVSPLPQLPRTSFRFTEISLTRVTPSSAAKTALLLDQTQLGTSAVHVEGASTLDDVAGPTAAAVESKEGEDGISQEDLPRSRIIAEYLAHGYVVSDNAIQKAIALDQKHGFSTQFTNALSNFDKKFNATDRAKGLDENYSITDKAVEGWRGLNSYFEKALNNPSGQKLRDFYAQTDKQVRDIHNEARRLADLKQGKSSETESGEAASSDPTGAVPSTEPKA